MKNNGMFWHVHHDMLMEYCYDFKERVNFIKSEKHKDEVAMRLKLFRAVRGKLPVEISKARAAYDKADAAYDKAYAA